jgi:hypothetical protein
MASFAFLGFKVPMPCTAPNGTRTGTGTPYPHSVKHGGKPRSVKHGGKIGLVENKTRSTPWWKTKWVRPPGGKQNFSGVLVENKTKNVYGMSKKCLQLLQSQFATV